MESTDRSISVVIPCHNAGPYLAQTLGSLLDQSRRPDEIIIVEDSSTDDSLEIARQFEAAFPDRIRVHSERSGNAPRTRNIGAALAAGDSLMFLDADDILAPDTLESLLSAMANVPDAGIVTCPWRRLELKGNAWISRPASCAPRRPDQDALSAWLCGWYYPPCSVLWSREAFFGVGGWDEEATLNQDGDLVMRALAQDVRLHEHHTGTAYYRRMPEGETSLSGKRFTYSGIAGRIRVLTKIAHLLQERSKLEPYREALGFAFDLIAADATGRFAGLCQQARMLSRQYGPPLRERALKRAGLKSSVLAGTRPTAAAPRNQEEEISFGIQQGAAVVAKAPPQARKQVEKRTDHNTVDKRPADSRSVNLQPTVSVVIPVYNRAHLLKRTLAGVLEQTFDDFEVLVVDDFSSDNPADVVASFEDSRIRYLRQAENRGVAAARNRGLREARAPFIAFLDDDDEWFPEKLARQVELFRQSPPDVGLIYTGVETVLDDGSSWLYQPCARGNLYNELLVKNILHGVPASGMIRRNVITSVGFFDEDLPAIEDYDYWLRICRHYRVDCIRDPLVRYNDLRGAAEGAEAEVRRSLNIKANLEARAQFYQKHGEEMRSAGLAHLFLVDSAQRHMVPEWHDMNGARRLAVEAFRLSPAAWQTRKLLLQVFMPWKLRKTLGKGRRYVAGLAKASKGKRKLHINQEG
ncbi:MAG: hypothetical protein CL583_04280 [Alteromonadaceae bacterium]|nr:hypothetical protein [Alteromonadaceae bacterium]|tara:strand:+ start:669 stop:2750 length:2082 start_codon:yes stop_codon:yes gene_type:complete